MRNILERFLFGDCNKGAFGKVGCARRAVNYALAFSVLLTTQMGSWAQELEVFGVKKRNKDYLMLSLIGYNYTDRHISDYSINGAGGGHINLSSAASGGSGQTCCVRLSKTTDRTLSIKVRWQVDGCKFVERDPRTGATDEIRHYYYKEIDINAQRMNDQYPRYIETHFYPDGSVKVRLTEETSEPLMSLDEKRPDKSSFPRCKNDEKPEQ